MLPPSELAFLNSSTSQPEAFTCLHDRPSRTQTGTTSLDITSNPPGRETGRQRILESRNPASVPVAKLTIRPSSTITGRVRGDGIQDVRKRDVRRIAAAAAILPLRAALPCISAAHERGGKLLCEARWPHRDSRVKSFASPSLPGAFCSNFDLSIEDCYEQLVCRVGVDRRRNRPTRLCYRMSW